tara:strand:- start:867 stop:1448 length:582 start_codon:yes stop_codon:yes gene_type:complete
MSKETLLKKEFKEADVQRVRNLVNKDFTGKTKEQVGYKKISQRYKEGDIWEESGKKWTIKNGLKQNITKFDAIKDLAKFPIACPKCKLAMKKRLDKKMYYIHGFCFDCTIDYEAGLKAAGLYEKYEKRMLSGNIATFITDMESWVLESLENDSSFVTEHGDQEGWNKLSKNYKDKIKGDLIEYVKILRTHIEE